jgi:hypothetical protein
MSMKTKDAARTPDSYLVKVKDLIRKEQRSQILTMFDSLMTEQRLLLVDQSVKNFYTNNGLTFKEARSIILNHLEDCVRGGLDKGVGRAYVDDAATFYIIPKESVDVAVANVIYGCLIRAHCENAISLGSLYGRDKEHMAMALHRAWTDLMSHESYEMAAKLVLGLVSELSEVLSHSEVKVGDSHNGYFEVPALLLFRKALSIGIPTAKAAKESLKMDDQLAANGAKDFLILKLTSNSFYRAYLWDQGPIGEGATGLVDNISKEFKADKHSAGKEAFIFNVTHLSFRKAEMAAKLTELTKDEQKLYALEACERLTMGTVGPAELKIISKISARFELGQLQDAF